MKKAATRPKKSVKGRPTRRDWQANHLLLRDAYVALWREHKRQPTYREMSARSGLNISSIQTHLRFPFEPLVHPARLMIDDVAMGVVQGARSGNSAMAKLYFELFHGYIPRTEVIGDAVTVKIIRGASMDDL